VPKRNKAHSSRSSKSNAQPIPDRGLARWRRLISAPSIIEQVIAGLLILVIAAVAGVVARHTLDRPANGPLQPSSSEFSPPSSLVQSTVNPARTTIERPTTTIERPTTTRDPGPPVRIISVTLERSDLQGGWVFPQRVDLSPVELTALNEIQRYSPQYNSWFRRQGGVDPSLSVVKIVVEGNRDDMVRIMGIRAVKHCQSPLTGTIFSDPPAGADDSIMIGFDLDSPNTDARVATPQSIGQRAYFASKTISLKAKEQQVLQVVAATLKHYCEYRLEMTVLDGDRVVTEVIGNGEQPFQVTSLIRGGADRHIVYSAYKAVYAGGVLTPDAAFVREDPATFNGQG
jgi:hypothetical protein